jgi:hypothetical protein
MPNYAGKLHLTCFLIINVTSRKWWAHQTGARNLPIPSLLLGSAAMKEFLFCVEKATSDSSRPVPRPYII